MLALKVPNRESGMSSPGDDQVTLHVVLIKIELQFLSVKVHCFRVTVFVIISCGFINDYMALLFVFNLHCPLYV